MSRLRDELLSLQTGDKPLDREGVHTQLSREETGAIVNEVERAITNKCDWFAEPGASTAYVETGWRQIVALKRELEAAERALLAEESGTAFARLCDIREQLSDLEGTEAVIEGYGADTGRSERRAS